MGKKYRADSRWSGRTDGFLWMHRSLIWMLKYINIRFFYFITDIVVIFYTILAHKKYLAIYHLFRVQLKRNPLLAFFNTYLTFYNFGHVIIDRFASYAGVKFQFATSGLSAFNKNLNEKKGCILLTTHLGNSELAGYFFPSSFPMYVLLFDGEKETISMHRQQLFNFNNIHYIYSQPDGSHIYQINKVLSDKNILTIFADRNFGSQKVIQSFLLSTPVSFPLGPFLLAEYFSSLPVFCMFVIKEKYKNYRVYLQRIEAHSKEEFASLYAQELSKMVERYPRQWYNFYEFWDED